MSMILASSANLAQAQISCEDLLIGSEPLNTYQPPKPAVVRALKNKGYSESVAYRIAAVFPELAKKLLEPSAQNKPKTVYRGLRVPPASIILEGQSGSTAQRSTKGITWVSLSELVGLDYAQRSSSHRYRTLLELEVPDYFFERTVKKYAGMTEKQLNLSFPDGSIQMQLMKSMLPFIKRIGVVTKNNGEWQVIWLSYDEAYHLRIFNLDFDYSSLFAN